MAIPKSLLESITEGASSYDYLKLFAAIEFGVNEAEGHLKDDINKANGSKYSNIRNHCFLEKLFGTDESPC